MKLLFLFAAALAPSIHTDFAGGSLGQVEKVSDGHYPLAAKGQVDQDGRNRQANWYYFRIDDAPLAPLTFDIVKLPGEYNYHPNQGAITKDTPPVISVDGIHWTHIKTFEYDPKEPKLTLRILPQGHHFWIAHCPPYTNGNLTKLRMRFAATGIFTKKSSEKLRNAEICCSGPSLMAPREQETNDLADVSTAQLGIRQLMGPVRARFELSWRIRRKAGPCAIALFGRSFRSAIRTALLWVEFALM